MKKTMLKLGGAEQTHSGRYAIKRRVPGPQVGVIVLGDSNDHMIDDAVSRGFLVDAGTHDGFVTVHKK